MNKYPKNWKEIATKLKDKFNWKCERCGHPHDKKSGHVLTVHHLVPDKALCEEWNLAVLCQRCHLHIQHKVNMFQEYFMPHSEWFIPHLRGFLKWVNQKEKDRQNKECQEHLSKYKDAMEIDFKEKPLIEHIGENRFLAWKEGE